MTKIAEDLDLPTGTPPEFVEVWIDVATAAGQYPQAYAADTIIGTKKITPNSAGHWTAHLVPTSEITPSGLAYRIRIIGKNASPTARYIEVPDSETTLQVADLLVDAPASVPTAALAAHAALRGLGGHLPDDAIDGQMVRYNADLEVWEAIDPPAGTGTVTSVQGIDPIGGNVDVLPLTAVDGQVLTWDGAAWVAVDPAGGVEEDPVAMAALALEIARAEAAELALSDALTAAVDGLQDDLTAEATARGDADDVLTASVASVAADLVDETARASGAEADLGNDLATEAGTRSAADSALDGRLDAIEADYLIAADLASAVSALEVDLAAEATVRAADDLLRVLISDVGTTVAPLSGGKIPTTYLPALAITSTNVVGSQAAMLALTAEEGDLAIRTDQNKTYILGTGSPATLGNWHELLTPTDAVSSVEGRTGAVTLGDLYDALGAAATAQAFAIQRANHTGTQSADTVTDSATKGTLLLTERTRLAGMETGATADQTAAEILAKVLTVDGPGSGLDADTLDGINSTGFDLAGAADAKVVSGAYDASAWDGDTTHAPSRNDVRDKVESILDGQVFTGELEAPSVKASGKTGATASPLVLGGGTATGAPVAGAHVVGEIVIDDTGALFRCTVAGTPGTWVDKYGTLVSALPTLANGTEVTFTGSSTLTPVLSAAAAVRVLGKAARAASAITSTSSATSVLANTITPAANSVAVGDRLRFTCWGLILNNVGSDQTFTFRLRYGSVNLCAFGALAVPTSANLRGFRMIVDGIITSASSGTMTTTGILTIGAANNALTTDTFDHTVFGTDQAVALGGWSALDVTVQHQSSGASQSTDAQGGLLIERIPA